MDQNLCGTEPPAILSLETFLHARTKELKTLKAAITEPKSHNKRSFQLLPKWKRRRAQSHNPYRIPRAYRNGILKELSRNFPKTSRRQRCDTRRTRNRLLSYRKRSGKARWLEETHLWHAKRFHMKTLWNYRLAYEACEKQKRRVHRYTSQRAVIHDKSYTEVIQVAGAINDLKWLFQLFNPRAVDIMFTPRMLLGGLKGTFPFFKLNSSIPEPFNALQWLQLREFIGPLQFLWSHVNCDRKRGSIWLFCHPAITNQILLNLRSGIHHRLQHKSDMLTNDDLAILKIEMMRGITIFEISGRLSLQVLMSLFHLSDPSKVHIPPSANNYMCGNDVWKILRPIACLDPQISPGLVIPLCIKIPAVLGPFPSISPQLSLPRQYESDTKNFHSLVLSWPLATLGAQIAEHFLKKTSSDEPKSRVKVTFRSRKRKNISKLIQHLVFIQDQYKQLKKKKKEPINPLLQEDFNRAVTKECARFETEETTVLIVRRCDTTPGNGSYNGYEIIFLPGSNATRFWTLMTRNKICAIGVVDRHRLLTAAGVPEFPWDYPCTQAGRLQALHDGKSLFNIYKSRPASKRVNFAAQSFPYPFCPNWNHILDKTNKTKTNILYNPLLNRETSTFCVIRPFHNLSLWEFSSCLHERPSCNSFLAQCQSIGHVICTLLLLPTNESALQFLKNFLSCSCIDKACIAVRVISAQKSLPKPRSHLYSMEASMMDALDAQTNRKVYLEKFWVPFLKSPAKHSSFTAKVSIEKEFKHKILKKKTQRVPFDELGQLGNNSKEFQQLVGFITSGGQSFRYGHGLGLGCVTLESLLKSILQLRLCFGTLSVNCLKSSVKRQLERILRFAPSEAQISKTLGNNIFSQLFVPYWFRSDTSLMFNMCWINVLTDEPQC
ncbi:uncharacterized protein LOC128883509 [Hylaeus volcanicus]|uniref:uncharacterized protein LOC128883509 n=1 Tax=Hylaeus volcanicus TaxID=313075 RepID=UPI0023B7C4F0|nr:uncharacterized protein LOC128883509 [Hylaeus volcanicus]